MRIAVRTLLRITVLLLLVGMAARTVHRRRTMLAAAPRDDVGPLLVRVAVAREGVLELARDHVATVESQSAFEVAARLTARVLSVSVREGDAVAAGEILATLESEDLRAALDAARAQATAAEAEVEGQTAGIATLVQTRDYLHREWDRIRSLQEGGAATEQQLDAARERLDEVSGRLAAARHRLDALGQAQAAAQARQRDAEIRIARDATLVSDSAGMVTARRVEPGDLATPGRALFSIASPALRLAFDVPPDDLSAAVPGACVRWTDPPPGGSAAVTRVHPALSTRRMGRVEADLDADSTARGLVLGSYVPLRLRTGQLDSATLVPVDALVTSPDLRSFVFVVEDGTLRAASVKVLGQAGGEVAVDGIAPGATVVESTYLGWTVLSAGRTVEVLE